MTNPDLRVLHISAGNLYGGVETVLATLARERNVCPTLHPHFALCFDGRIAVELRVAGTPPTMLGPVRLRNPVQLLRARARLRKLLREEKFDAVICHMAWTLAVFGGTIRQSGVPLLFWLHDVATGRDRLEKLARRVRPDLVIANSRFTGATLPTLFPDPPPLDIINEPAAPPRDSIAASDRDELRAKLGVTPRNVVIVQVSRMERYKGHAVLLDALARLTELRHWRCWFVGGAQRETEQTYLNELRQRAAAAGISGCVSFLGQRSDVPRLLAAADIFCQPNIRGEPFGLVFCEALFARLPVVATAIGGALEIVTEECGRLVPPSDAVALSASLRELIENVALRIQLGDNGPARASALSDPALATARLEAAVRRSIELHSKGADAR
jgi:glycosyltransferase involved in cell wall biosynthesis